MEGTCKNTPTKRERPSRKKGISFLDEDKLDEGKYWFIRERWSRRIKGSTQHRDTNYLFGRSEPKED